MLRAAARRFVTLLAVTTAIILVGSIGLGLLLDSSLNRSISLGFYGVGAFFVVGAFALGNRGPYRSANEEGTIRVGRRLRRATPEEMRESVNMTVLLVALGFVLLAAGAAIDSRYELV